MSNNINVGEVVLCIDSTQILTNPPLKQGELYKVVSYDGLCARVQQGSEGNLPLAGCVFLRRFKKIGGKGVDPYPIAHAAKSWLDSEPTKPVFSNSHPVADSCADLADYRYKPEF